MARVRISIDGFRDPVRRPRWIVWTLVTVILIAAVMIPVLGITSTRWFCSEGCHKVQDDTILAYQHSPHSEISCMACHMPVNANPVIFLVHKAEALGELAQTVTNNYELPLNAESEVALTMKSTQCTQCHTPNRVITPNEGIKIDHGVHTANGVQCTICHNRTAHVEDFKPKLINPKTGEPSKKHENFMEMTACFRCHTQERKPNAPGGECFLCHTPEFELLPTTHKKAGFFPSGHGKLAIAEEKRAPWMNATETAQAETAPVDEQERYAGENLVPVQKVNLCSTCHSKAFCTDCHGVAMPHPADFQKKHGAVGKAAPQVCEKCHGEAGVDFCNACHHGRSIDYKYNAAIPWKQQHPIAVASTGSAACLKCHNPTYCAVCHVTGKPPANTN